MFSPKKPPAEQVSVIVDGLQVHTDTAGKMAVEKLQRQLAETISAKDEQIESLRAENMALQTERAEAVSVADQAAQHAADLQQQLADAKSPPVIEVVRDDGSAIMDPVVLALRDSGARRTFNDNGYSESLRRLQLGPNYKPEEG